MLPAIIRLRVRNRYNLQCLKISTAISREEESVPQIKTQQDEQSSYRKPLPDHLPREDVRLDIDNMTCAVVAARCMSSVRASTRCWTGFWRSCA